MQRIAWFAAWTLVTATLAGCGDLEGVPFGEPRTGALTIAVADAPVDEARSVVVSFSGVEITPDEGEPILFEFVPRQIDLLALDPDERVVLIENRAVAAGQYDGVRLLVEAEPNTLDSYVELLNGAQSSLSIPPDARAALGIVQGFVVPEGGSTNLTVDFDLRKSVREPVALGADFLLLPELRMVDQDRAGAVAGLVESVELLGADCTPPAVYVYEGINAVTGDLGSAAPPLTSALVYLNTFGDWRYHVDLLPPGDYTVAFTCDASADSPAVADVGLAIPFRFDFPFQDQQLVQNVSVAAGETTTADFTPGF